MVALTEYSRNISRSSFPVPALLRKADNLSFIDMEASNFSSTILFFTLPIEFEYLFIEQPLKIVWTYTTSL
jgi:hypothetical protein